MTKYFISVYYDVTDLRAWVETMKVASPFEMVADSLRMASMATIFCFWTRR
jgi:hypothetical protein